MALPAYRTLLRSISLAFANDARVMLSARHQARATFQQHAALDPAGDEAAAQIAHAADVASILRRNVVQGERVAASGAEDGEERYRLRLHEDTERGDNESLKNPGKKGPLAGRGREIPRSQ